MKPGDVNEETDFTAAGGGTPMASWTPPQGLAGSPCPKGGPQGDAAVGARLRGALGKSHFTLQGPAAGTCRSKLDTRGS